MLSFLINTGMFAYSIVSIPYMFIVIAIYIIELIDFSIITSIERTIYYNFGELVMFSNLSLAILFVMIPYASILIINKYLFTADILTISWYHTVVLSTVGFNGGAVALYYYTTYLIAAPPKGLTSNYF